MKLVNGSFNLVLESLIEYLLVVLSGSTHVVNWQRRGTKIQYLKTNQVVSDDRIEVITRIRKRNTGTTKRHHCDIHIPFKLWKAIIVLKLLSNIKQKESHQSNNG